MPRRELYHCQNPIKQEPETPQGEMISSPLRYLGEIFMFDTFFFDLQKISALMLGVILLAGVALFFR